MPCDPNGGFPEPQAGCPDAHPVTGWLTGKAGGLLLSPFRTFINDAEGREYAREHGEEFPFPNDHFDAPTGTPEPLAFSSATVCTGIILVGYRLPMVDHVVPCEKLVAVAAGGQRGPVPVAVWTASDSVVQVSELYRP